MCTTPTCAGNAVILFAALACLVLLVGCEYGTNVKVVNQTEYSLDSYMGWPKVDPHQTINYVAHGVPKGNDDFVYMIRAFIPRGSFSPSRILIFCEDITERDFRAANWTVLYRENVPVGTPLITPSDPCP